VEKHEGDYKEPKKNRKRQNKDGERGSVLADITPCFNKCGWELVKLALNLLYYLATGRKKAPKAIKAKKYQLKRKHND